MRATTNIRPSVRKTSFRTVSFAALGISIACSACVEAEEQPDFNTYPGHAVPSTGGDGDAGDTPGGSTGATSGGGTSGGSPANNTGGASNGGVGTSGGVGSSGGTNSTGSASGGSGSGTTGAANGGSSGAGTTGATGATTGGTTGATTGGGSGAVSSLTFSVLTKEIGGEYAPRNVGAIWITNSSGTFVKTLELWARTRLKYLTTFQQQTNRNSVDAVTGATLNTHRVHNATWNLKDVNGVAVPDGMYNLVIETSDHDTVSHTIPFMKGSAPATITPPDVANYVQMSIKLQ